MIDEGSSLRIQLLRFPLVVGVVFLHAWGTTVGLAGGEMLGMNQPSGFADFVRNLVSQGFARTAVPTFFLVSGFLFFNGLEWPMRGYAAKLKTRLRTLLVPYLFWNVAWLLALALAQAIPAYRTFFSGVNNPIASYSTFDYVNAVFGIGGPPIAYQFWFIRDLMLLTLIAPLIAYAIRLTAWPFLMALSACWLAGVWPVYAPSAEATLFFAFGGYVASRGRSIFDGDKYGRIVLCAYIPVVVVDALLVTGPLHPLLHRFGVVLGVAAVLSLTRGAARSPKVKRVLVALSGASFFVFATHEYLLTALRKVSYRAVSPDSSGEVLLLYFIIPAALVALLVATYRLLLHLTPRFLEVITGGRQDATHHAPAKFAAVMEEPIE